MKKTIGGMVDFPLQGQSVRFVACLAALLMKADGMERRGYASLYGLYTLISGFGLMQLDLSDDGQMAEDWNQSANVLLREFDWYIGFAFDHAGYDFEELTFFEDDKLEDWQAIVDSIDRDMPVLALFGGKYSWVLVTGYDERGTLYGLDGHETWGEPYERPASYDGEGRFVLPDWFERRGHAFILKGKKPCAVTKRDVLCRSLRLMEDLQGKAWLRRSEDWLKDDRRFDGLTDDGLLAHLERVIRWMSMLTEQRSVCARAMESWAKEFPALSRVSELMHQQCRLLWQVWSTAVDARSVDRLALARRMCSRAVRQLLVQSIESFMACEEAIIREIRRAIQ